MSCLHCLPNHIYTNSFIPNGFPLQPRLNLRQFQAMLIQYGRKGLVSDQNWSKLPARLWPRASRHAVPAAVRRDRPLGRFGRFMTAGTGPDRKDRGRFPWQGPKLGIQARHRRRIPRRSPVVARAKAPGRDQGARQGTWLRAAAGFTETGIRPGELGSAFSAGRGAGMRPGFPAPKGSSAPAKRNFLAAPRPLPPVSARLFLPACSCSPVPARLLPGPEHDPKAHVSTSRAAANAPALDRDRSKALPFRDGGLRCRGGQFAYGNEPKRVSSTRHP